MLLVVATIPAFISFFYEKTLMYKEDYLESVADIKEARRDKVPPGAIEKAKVVDQRLNTSHMVNFQQIGGNQAGWAWQQHRNIKKGAY